MPLFQPARKRQLKARVAIDGPTGSGKTYTALQWATILADGNPIGLIDTENRSAALYAGTSDDEPADPHGPPFTFGHLPIHPPYDPRELARLVKEAAAELGPDGVLVIDSLTHFWTGDGGTLDIVDNAAHRGNSFTGWKEGTPAQRHMIDSIIHADCHIIVTMRSKMEYALETDDRTGKTAPRKIGLAPEQRAGIEYEFTVVADMDLEHRVVISKSRCSLIADVVAPMGRTHEPAQTFAAWLNDGEKTISPETAEALIKQFNDVPEAERSAVKQQFMKQFGRPNTLAESELADAVDWIASHTPEPAAKPDPVPAKESTTE